MESEEYYDKLKEVDFMANFDLTMVFESSATSFDCNRRIN
jgi:hypothetical protein